MIHTISHQIDLLGQNYFLSVLKHSAFKTEKDILWKHCKSPHCIICYT